jgi:hypothetical protein
LYLGLRIKDGLTSGFEDYANPHYEEPQLVQLVELQELHDDPCELVNPSSLLWLKVERNFLTLVPLQVGQVIFWSPKTRVSKSLSHFMQ